MENIVSEMWSKKIIWTLGNLMTRHLLFYDWRSFYDFQVTQIFKKNILKISIISIEDYDVLVFEDHPDVLVYRQTDLERETEVTLGC